MWLLTLLFPLVAVVAKNLDTSLDYLANENQDTTLDYLAGENQVLAVNYLAKYGYLPADTAQARASVSGEKIREAVRQFQAFAGLEQTGEVDKNMLELLKLPRCGVSDVGNRTTRYVLNIPLRKWDNPMGLTYRISKYSKHGLTQAETDSAFRRAFALWEKVTNVHFTKMSDGQADIEIRFEEGSHGGHPSHPSIGAASFDGPSDPGCQIGQACPGSELAHAFAPGDGFWGDIHMDDSENWHSRQGKDLLQVATHEIGHSLGLRHSIRDSIMYEAHIPMNTVRLHSDDVEGIQELYGRK